VDLAALLRPYIDDLSPAQLNQVSTYIDILLRWNARMNLTAIRDPETIVTRHFGESFFLARKLSENRALTTGQNPDATTQLIDIGSGAGFPGIPIKIVYPRLTLSLVEAQQRKSVFLKEVLRSLHLDAEVINARAEVVAEAQSGSADVVTLRAVEKFDSILPTAARLVSPTGTLALLIGDSQVEKAKNLLETWHFEPVCPIPGAQNRVILLGNQGG
jgi:16S rRNA (guanine527-N7)-methyltransferase